MFGVCPKKVVLPFQLLLTCFLALRIEIGTSKIQVSRELPFSRWAFFLLLKIVQTWSLYRLLVQIISWKCFIRDTSQNMQVAPRIEMKFSAVTKTIVFKPYRTINGDETWMLVSDPIMRPTDPFSPQQCFLNALKGFKCSSMP